jgi:hypothetical protein
MSATALIIPFPDPNPRTKAINLATDLAALSRDIRFHGHLDNADRAASMAFVAADIANEITLLQERFARQTQTLAKQERRWWKKFLKRKVWL